MSAAPGPGRDPIEFIETFAGLWRCLMALSDEAYADEKLFSAQARFLRYIGQHRGISQVELARAMDMAPTLTGRLLRTLIQRGLVKRARSDEDRREYLLGLGASGQRMRRKVEQARGRFAARVVGVLDARDLQDFDRIARKLFAAFGERPLPPSCKET
ncbi:MarR family transcriptional regulator [Myxococcus sp. K38C18041901]|uniref:MarR family winged helix-turn-helix transcriptional regulator n=1 Tax=Myxococcus guangdongensis TaxID=2906760 RepID=UPI0020A70BF8|nr:MarR family transcriptional regulator [Myxococcus guangdongensis]MCP3065573.1 MarR family transcriptional regulator [Myxococcus guangdongensis]